MARTASYRATEALAFQPGGDAFTRPAFSIGNRVRRALWSICWVLFYRFSPRPLHGWRTLLLRCFGARMGSHCHFYPGSRVWAPWNLRCDDHVAAADGAEIYNPSPVELASHVILSQDSYLCGATHDYNDPEFPLTAYRMRVGAYAWICARACIAPGVNVAEGAVLGLGAVATRDLLPWTVYGGNPAVALRPRQRTAPAGLSGEPAA